MIDVSESRGVNKRKREAPRCTLHVGTLSAKNHFAASRMDCPENRHQYFYRKTTRASYATDLREQQAGRHKTNSENNILARVLAWLACAGYT